MSAKKYIIKYAIPPLLLATIAVGVKIYIDETSYPKPIDLNSVSNATVMVVVIGNTDGELTGGNFDPFSCDSNRMNWKYYASRQFLNLIRDHEDPHVNIRSDFLLYKKHLNRISNSNLDSEPFYISTNLGDTWILTDLPSEQHILKKGFRTPLNSGDVGLINKNGKLFLRKGNGAREYTKCDYPIAFYRTTLKNVEDASTYVPVIFPNMT